MNEVVLWLAFLAALPAFVVLASFFTLKVERLRSIAVVCATGSLLVSILPQWFLTLRLWEFAPLRTHAGLWGSSLLRMSTLSSILLPFTACLWLLTVAATPRGRLDRAGLCRTAIATLLTFVSFLTINPALLAICWLGSVLVFLAALSVPQHRRAWRIAITYLGASTIFFIVGVFIIAECGPRNAQYQPIGIGLIALAALIRKGIFPFHAWVAEVCDRGRLGPTVLFSAPQVGAYVTAMLVVPQATPALLHVITILALVTAVYSAILALVQAEARRTCGYLFVSQSAFVMAGLDGTSHEALTGSMVIWFSSGLAFAGLSRCVLVLEARRGRLDLRQYHGGYEHMPLLAASFLVMGLACIGFPGTLGFVGEEMLISGAIEVFPVLGFFVILAGALTGLAVLRMYFSLFCGKRDNTFPLVLSRRERIAFAAVAIILVGFGLAPNPMVSQLTQSSTHILSLRNRHAAEP